MKIDEMPAGREMDALIAEKIIKWTVFWNPREFNNYSFEEDEIAYGFPPDEEVDGVPYEIPEFSTDIKAAWEIAEKLRITVTPDIGHGWLAAWCNASGGGETNWVGITNGRKWISADTAPLAICRAALIELGVTEV